MLRFKFMEEFGIDFERNRKQGIDSAAFTQLLLCSGLVRNNNIGWVIFQGNYDFAYLIKLLTSQKLEATGKSFSVSVVTEALLSLILRHQVHYRV